MFQTLFYTEGMMLKKMDYVTCCWSSSTWHGVKVTAIALWLLQRMELVLIFWFNTKVNTDLGLLYHMKCLISWIFVCYKQIGASVAWLPVTSQQNHSTAKTHCPKLLEHLWSKRSDVKSAKQTSQGHPRETGEGYCANWAETWGILRGMLVKVMQPWRFVSLP